MTTVLPHRSHHPSRPQIQADPCRYGYRHHQQYMYRMRRWKAANGRPLHFQALLHQKQAQQTPPYRLYDPAQWDHRQMFYLRNRHRSVKTKMRCCRWASVPRYLPGAAHREPQPSNQTAKPRRHFPLGRSGHRYRLYPQPPPSYRHRASSCQSP